jgi:hypothetical protein
MPPGRKRIEGSACWYGDRRNKRTQAPEGRDVKIAITSISGERGLFFTKRLHWFDTRGADPNSGTAGINRSTKIRCESRSTFGITFFTNAEGIVSDDDCEDVALG